MKGLELFEPGTYFHVVNHAVGDENLFRNDENYHYFLRKYATYMPSVWATLAYCLMPNHIHLLVRVHDEKTLSKHTKSNPKFALENLFHP